MKKVTHTESCICKYCGFFINPQNLENHTRHRHFCDVCQDFFHNKKKCEHLKERFAEERRKCEFCNKSVKFYDMKRHIEEVHNSKPVEKMGHLCSQCGKSFDTEHKLDEHEKTTLCKIGLDMKKFECKDCDKFFPTHGRLRKHQRMVHGEKDVQCQHCTKTFTHQKLLNQHVKVKHEKKLLCHHCDRKFGTKSVLDQHVKTIHEGIKRVRNHKCDQCNELFANLKDLGDHTEHSHDKSRPFECATCLKNFHSREKLDHHVSRVHQLRNVESCPYCQKQYSQLKKHIPKCNSKGKRDIFKCSYCDESYLLKTSLNEHIILIHTFDRT